MPGQGTKIPQAAQHGQNLKKKKIFFTKSNKTTFITDEFYSI